MQIYICLHVCLGTSSILDLDTSGCCVESSPRSVCYIILGFASLAVTHFLIWPHHPKRLVYRHVIYFYKPELFVGNPNAKTHFCQRVCALSLRELCRMR